MQYVDWFVATIKDKFDMVVDSEEVSFEAYEFYHEELDELLIPEEHLKNFLTLYYSKHCCMWMMKVMNG
ncbi:hypothetical protein [Heyndrickxia acidicola]|uniref:Uncharacterized protein n=1 Tax=Heyndrickxia acidicola TaxID=209389 RepID=A0ABU6MFY8_9BACI|nr:hypothetical protein [Heyndrickxia acidicola]MED1203287.1 hypothetical protein [Heyndrickxia acidicola]